MRRTVTTVLVSVLLGFALWWISIKSSTTYEYESPNLEMSVYDEGVDAITFSIRLKKKFLMTKELDSVQTHDQNGRRIALITSNSSKYPGRLDWIHGFQRSNTFRDYFETYDIIQFHLYFSDGSSYYIALHQETKYRSREFRLVLH
jgi:hypothetical protein